MSHYCFVMLPDCGFQGPRHDRLRGIWQALKVYWRDRASVHFFSNPGCVWAHHECLSQMFAAAIFKHRGTVILTELDFLPSFRWFFRESRPHEKAIIAPQYAWGVGGHPKRKSFDFPAAWYISIDLQMLYGEPNFLPGGEFNDPGYFLDATLLPVSFGWPEHCGAEIETGTHLFWQRHLHDDPDMVVGEEKMRLGDMQEKFDRAVDRWLENAPDDFTRIYDARNADN